MKDSIQRIGARLQLSFRDFTMGQKVIAILGSLALLLAAFMVYRWASTPSYAPLYSNLSASDASAVVDKLDSEGVPHQISNGGATIMVPQSQVYETRIALSGEGLPSGSDNGYSILDNQSLSTSSFKEQTDFKRAMEGELDNTIEAIDGIKTAVVHLALPQKQVFADKQEPATASVLVKMAPGGTLATEQVQAITNLVASSVDGLKPEAVTVADSSGRVLSAADGAFGTAASGRFQQIDDFQNQMTARIQTMLDRVVGPGNATAQVTADLDYDNTKTTTTRYFPQDSAVVLSGSTSTETYSGAGGTGAGSTGVVGADGQMDTSAAGGSGSSSYKKSNSTSDNAVDATVEERVAAPGGVKGLHVAVVLDAAKAAAADPTTVKELLSAGLGINAKRGDTVQVSAIAFDRSAEELAAADLKAADAAASGAQRMTMIRTGIIGLVLLLIVAMAWMKMRRRDKARIEATSYVVEQLRKDAIDRTATQPVIDQTPAMAALERSDNGMTDQMRDEIADLVERQPEDVAALLRGWLVEHQ